jgi:magnesium transporter
MNFEYMPELRWTFMYPFALSLTGLVSVSLYLIFKGRNWL